MIVTATDTYCEFRFPNASGDFRIRIRGTDLVYDEAGNLISGTVTRIIYDDRPTGGPVSTWDYSSTAGLSVAVLAANDPAWTSPSGYLSVFGAGDGIRLVANAAVTPLVGAGGADTIILTDPSGGSLHGDAGNDLLRGTGAGPLLIDGGSGNDTLVGSGGNDTLLGGDGDDTVSAGGGDDLVDTGAGAFSVRAGGGNDTVFGGDGGGRAYGEAGDDLIMGGIGRETISGGDGDDVLFGGGSPSSQFDGTVFHAGDRINGDAGNDTILGMEGNDTLSGGDGDDFVGSFAGTDIYFGGAGADTFAFYASTEDHPAYDVVPGHTVSVNDFSVAEDSIHIASWFPHTAAENYATFLAHAHQAGSHVVYDSGDGILVTLRNVDLDDLSVANFVETLGSVLGVGG